MKTILLLASLLLMTFTSICQIDTHQETQQKTDSLIYLPKSLVIHMIQDLAAGDACQEENAILTNSLDYNQKKIYKQDSVITVYKEKVQTYKNEISTYENLDTENQKTIQNLNYQVTAYKRKNKVLKILSTVFLGMAAGFALK